MPVATFETARLTARPIASEDAAVLSVLHHDPRVMATLGGIRSDEQTHDFLVARIGHWERHGYGMWMFQARGDGRFVGRGGLQHIEVGGRHEIEVGYTVRAEEWGKGFATEMADAIVEVAVAGLGIRNLVAFTLPSNAASRRVMENAGFTFEREVDHEGQRHVLYRRVAAG
jgi:ribosomal-protein-alanine N-acetyltransferase